MAKPAPIDTIPYHVVIIILGHGVLWTSQREENVLLIPGIEPR
jgi:hypothetical protein